MAGGEDLHGEVSRILQSVTEKKNSLRNLVFSSHFRNKKQLLRLCCETLKYQGVVWSIIQENQELTKLASELRDGTWPLCVAMYESHFGSPRDYARWVDPSLKKALKRFNHLILASKSRLIEEGTLGKDGKISEDAQRSGGMGSSKSAIKVPRYARINTVMIDPESAIRTLEEDGWTYLQAQTAGFSRKRFRNFVSNLSSDQFCSDKDIPDLLVFPHGTDLHRNSLVENGALLLQDKLFSDVGTLTLEVPWFQASCLSSLCLNPEPGSCVLDTCAAPGMKTTHLAAIMENQGKILAIDKVHERVETLNSVLGSAGVTCVTIECEDFLEANLEEKRFKKIRFALVDPPCSGSGIVSRMDHLTDQVDSSKDAKRLNGLGNLQAMLLKHAMKLPQLERVVYSTCSVQERENEMVVGEVLADEFFGSKFHLVHAFSKWKHRGKKNYEFGRLCLRSSPQKDLTNGFFVAVFERTIQ